MKTKNRWKLLVEDSWRTWLVLLGCLAVLAGLLQLGAWCEVG